GKRARRGGQREVDDRAVAGRRDGGILLFRRLSRGAEVCVQRQEVADVGERVAHRRRPPPPPNDGRAPPPNPAEPPKWLGAEKCAGGENAGAGAAWNAGAGGANERAGGA